MTSYTVLRINADNKSVGNYAGTNAKGYTMNAAQAKRIVRDWLSANGFPQANVTAKSVSFDGNSRIFVTVHDWQPDGKWMELKAVAKSNGFILSETIHFVS